MQLHFSSKDSIYHILSSLKKIASYKEVSLLIEKNHDIFAHAWWGQQIKSLVEEKHLQLTCIAYDNEQKLYFSACGLETRMAHKHVGAQAWDYISRHIFFTQSLKAGLQERPQVYALLLVVEVALFAFLLRVLRTFISPNTVITITPQYMLDTLATNIIVTTGEYHQGERAMVIEAYPGTVAFRHTASLAANSVRYVIQPAQGEVIIYNLLPREVKLVKGTRLQTKDGLLFRTNKEVFLYASDGIHPTNAKVRVMAMEYKEDGSPIGKLGNITPGTVLFVKNLPDTHENKTLYAEAAKGLQGGATTLQGSVLAKDIADLETVLTTQAYQERIRMLHNQLEKNSASDITLPFPDMIGLTGLRFHTNVVVGQASPFIEGSIEGSILYYYLPRSRVESLLQAYIQQRSSDFYRIHHIDFDRLQFEHKRLLTGGVAMVTTKVSSTQQYDFKKDAYEIIKEIRGKIIGLSKEEAKNILVSYNEIAQAEVKITPWWYRSISSNPERIEFIERTENKKR